LRQMNQLHFHFFFSFVKGVHSQRTLTQLASVSGSLGQTITLSCTKGSGSWNTGVYWYQQKSGESPRFVHCNGCGTRGPGIPDRFTATASGNTGSLTITNLQAGDEANYYCFCRYYKDLTARITVVHSHGDVRPKLSSLLPRTSETLES
uniref:Ig-like domain-containing protein n=1 Tax=Anolis carolinensis TaxID=28377 RepID=A0A803THZ6_ANOCA